QVVDFTDKYYNTPAKFVAPKAAKLDIPEEVAAANEMLSGMRVGVQRATIHENFLRARFPAVEVVSYATQEEANLDLTNGRLDLVMADSIALLEGFVNTEAGEDYEYVGPDYDDPDFHGAGAGIAIRKGEEALVEGFNAAIAQIRSDGTYKQINDKYFAFDVYGAED
ncbi:MAG: transporter substrate-binding domain-containing protein, partial [Tistlia sp.]